MLTDIIVDRNKPSVTINGVLAERMEYREAGDSPTGYGGICKSEIFFSEDYVVKFGGREYTKYIEPEHRDFFANVVFVSLDKRWYVQERVQCEKFAPVSDAQHAIARRVASGYGVHDISTYSPRPSHGHDFEVGHNFTVDRNGKIKIFDFDG